MSCLLTTCAQEDSLVADAVLQKMDVLLCLMDDRRGMEWNGTSVHNVYPQNSRAVLLQTCDYEFQDSTSSK